MSIVMTLIRFLTCPQSHRKWLRIVVCVLPSRMARMFCKSKSWAMKLILPFLKLHSSQDMWVGRKDQPVLNLNSFNLRMTVEVDTDKLSSIAVIESFSISFWAILWLTIGAGIWWFFLTREVSATAIFLQFWQRKRRFFKRMRVL